MGARLGSGSIIEKNDTLVLLHLIHTKVLIYKLYIINPWWTNNLISDYNIHFSELRIIAAKIPPTELNSVFIYVVDLYSGTNSISSLISKTVCGKPSSVALIYTTSMSGHKLSRDHSSTSMKTLKDTFQMEDLRCKKNGFLSHHSEMSHSTLTTPKRASKTFC